MLSTKDKRTGPRYESPSKSQEDLLCQAHDVATRESVEVLFGGGGEMVEGRRLSVGEKSEGTRGQANSSPGATARNSRGMRIGSHSKKEVVG